MAGVAHLTEEQRNSVIQKIQDFESWCIEIRTTLESTDRHLDLPYTLAQIDNKLNSTETECYAIINSPPPKPKKEDSKKEEEKKDDDKMEEEKKEGDGTEGAAGADAGSAAAGDADMKDEATI